MAAHTDDLAPPPSAPDAASDLSEPQPSDWTFDGVVETTQQDSLGVSGDDSLQVSFASESDLEELREIHARASIKNPLACCLVHEPKEFITHIELGLLHYSQAFCKGATAVALKVTDQRSKAIVGCAILRRHGFHNMVNGRVLISRPREPITSLVTDAYIIVHDEIQKYRRRTLKERGTRGSETLHYCEYR